MEPHAASNFLVPNATFIVELLAFIFILVVLGRYVIPPINKALADRQNLIRQQLADAKEAKERADAAENEYKSQLVEARHEAARIREEAKEQGTAILAEMRETAQAESDRIIAHAHAQLEAERQHVVNQLRSEVGTIATTLASTIVGESLEDDERRSRTVERFIAQLQDEQPSGSRP
jgi:F-type H+-transporting ATPase subunit b